MPFSVSGERLLALALTLAVANCSHMPVTSMLKLARVDLTSTDPARLRAAVKLPRVIRPQSQGVTLRIGVKLSSGEEDTQDFMLREGSDRQDSLALESELDPDTHVFTYRLDPDEIARLTAFRDALKRTQTRSGGRGGALTIAVHPQACRTGELPTRPLYVTTYLRTAETGSFVPLTRDLDLRMIDPKQDLTAVVPPCNSSAL